MNSEPSKRDEDSVQQQSAIQLDAIGSVIDLLDGQPLAGGAFEFRFDSSSGLGFTELGSGNKLDLATGSVLKNLRAVQERNEIAASTSLESMDFTVEMETGTGKTYVYLRTLYELNAKDGFTKFVIVVPSVAIREGVLSSIRLIQRAFSNSLGQCSGGRVGL